MAMNLFSGWIPFWHLHSMLRINSKINPIFSSSSGWVQEESGAMERVVGDGGGEKEAKRKGRK